RQLLGAKGQELAYSLLPVPRAPSPETAEAMIVELIVGFDRTADPYPALGFLVDIGGEQKIAYPALVTVVHFPGYEAAVIGDAEGVIGVIELGDPPGGHRAVGVRGTGRKESGHRNYKHSRADPASSPCHFLPETTQPHRAIPG